MQGLRVMPEAWTDGYYFPAVYAPIVITVLFKTLWSVVHAATKFMEPFYQLQKEGGASAAESLLSDFLSSSLSTESVLNVFRKHWVMTLTSGVYALATVVMMIASEAMTIRSGNDCTTPEEPLKCDLQWVVDTIIARILQIFMAFSAAMILARIILNRKRSSGIFTYPGTIAAMAALLRKRSVVESFMHIEPEANTKSINKALSENYYGLRKFEQSPGIYSYGLVQIAAPVNDVWWAPANLKKTCKHLWSLINSYQPGPSPASKKPEVDTSVASTATDESLPDVIVEVRSEKPKFDPLEEGTVAKHETRCAHMPSHLFLWTICLLSIDKKQ